MPPARPDRTAYLMLALAPALMISNMLAARWVAGSIPAVSMAFWRWALTFLLVLPFVAVPLWRARHRLRAEWRTLLALGALGMGVCGAPVYLGGQTTSATNIGLIYAASPVLIVLFARAFWGEPVSLRQAAGIALCLSGVTAIVSRGDPAVLLGLAFTRGDLWIVFATLGWALYSVLLRYQRTELPLLVRFAAIVLAGVLVNLPLYLLEMAAGQWAAFDPRTVGTVLFLALVPGLSAFLVYNRLVAVLGPSRAGLTLYLGPLYNVALAWLLLGEAPQFQHLLGGLLILPGLYLATVPARPRHVATPSRA